MRRFLFVLTSIVVAGGILAACGSSGSGKVTPKTGLVNGTLEVIGGPPGNQSNLVDGHVWFTYVNTGSYVVKRVAVGSSGHFITTLTPGTWRVNGSTPHYMHGKPGYCRASDIVVKAGYSGTNVVVECQQP